MYWKKYSPRKRSFANFRNSGPLSLKIPLTSICDVQFLNISILMFCCFNILIKIIEHMKLFLVYIWTWMKDDALFSFLLLKIKIFLKLRYFWKYVPLKFKFFMILSNMSFVFNMISNKVASEVYCYCTGRGLVALIYFWLP